MEYTNLNAKDDFLRYPTNKVVGMLRTAEEVHAAVVELNNAGFGEDAIGVLSGKKGADRLDITGKNHGPIARLYRFVEKAADLEFKELRKYRGGLLQGEFVIGIVASDKDKQDRALQILKSHGGHRINFFNRWFVESLAA